MDYTSSVALSVLITLILCGLSVWGILEYNGVTTVIGKDGIGLFAGFFIPACISAAITWIKISDGREVYESNKKSSLSKSP